MAALQKAKWSLRWRWKNRLIYGQKRQTKNPLICDVCKTPIMTNKPYKVYVVKCSQCNRTRHFECESKRWFQCSICLEHNCPVCAKNLDITTCRDCHKSKACSGECASMGDSNMFGLPQSYCEKCSTWSCYCVGEAEVNWHSC